MNIDACNILDIRIAWTLGTAQVLAIFALSSLSLEERLTLMAGPAHTLRRSSSGHFLPSRAVYHGESIMLLVHPLIGGDSRNSFAL